MPLKPSTYFLGLGGFAAALFGLHSFFSRVSDFGDLQKNAKPIPFAHLATPSAKSSEDPSEAKLDEKTYHGSGPETESMKAIVFRFNAGDLGVALKLARAALADQQTSEGFKAWLTKQMPTLLTSAAWWHLKSDRCYEAIDLLREAETLEKSPVTSRGLAFCYNKLQNFGIASQYFDDYLRESPNDAVMSQLYADALENDLRFDDAVAVLEKAVQNVPTDKQLNASLRAMRAKALESPKQVLFTTPNFRVIYRAEEHADIVDDIADTLESTFLDFNSHYGFKPPKAPIDVILYPLQSFKKVSANGPDWAAGIFDGRIRIPIKGHLRKLTPEIERTLRHELVHALIAHMSDYRVVTTWFSEGLAQLLECKDRPCRPDKRLIPASPGNFLTNEELNAPFIKFDYIKAEKGYRQSLLLFYTLLDAVDLETDDILQRIVSRIDEKAPLASDDLIAPSGLKFKDLYNRAAKAWAR